MSTAASPHRPASPSSSSGGESESRKSEDHSRKSDELSRKSEDIDEKSTHRRDSDDSSKKGVEQFVSSDDSNSMNGDNANSRRGDQQGGGLFSRVKGPLYDRAKSVIQRKTGKGKTKTPEEIAEEKRKEEAKFAKKLWKEEKREAFFQRQGPIVGEAMRVVYKYGQFVGPGFLVAVAYIDPGNYATDVAAGASYRFSLLFMVLLSNIFAIFLQSLCVKLGSVTGMNLAENMRAHMPRWLNYVLYFFGEAAIIATDIAEVIGTAISLNLLINVPLVAGCAISIIDVLIILFFYNPNGGMKGIRAFEYFVMCLVFGVVICFCFELSLIKDTSVGEVFRGYVPSSALVESKGLYQACGILGATVMPHSLYLGSGIVQPRLMQFDSIHGTGGHTIQEDINATEGSGADSNHSSEGSSAEEKKYRPSLAAIKSCMTYSTVELGISLFTFALFVNSAILITAGSSLSDTKAGSADLFGIYDLLSNTLAPAAGTLFALALLLSGTSAGIVCTIAGQMVSEGQLRWNMAPWLRRLITRSISITPSIIIAGAVGAEGLSTALEASQVALSVILPFVSAPLLWFTCRPKFMTVATQNGRVVSTYRGDNETREDDEENRGENSTVCLKTHWLVATIAVIIWLIICVMNVALLVLAGMGIDA